MKTINRPKRVTYASVLGGRSHQEDRIARWFFRGKGFKGYLLAIMDGHGGSEAAEICAQQMKSFFLLTNPGESENALRELVARLHEETKGLYQGTTLAIACVLESHDKVSIAILGDSQVVVIDELGEAHVSPEHNVRTNFTERAAAMGRGAHYFEGRIHNYVIALQMSRALGDRELNSVLSREPEVYTIQAPRWIAVASDGVLDPKHGESGKLIDELVELGKKGADAKRLMSWVHGPDHRLSDNASVIVWKAKTA